MRLTDDEPVRTTFRNLIAIILGASAIAGAGVRWELKLNSVQEVAAQHTEQLKSISEVQSDSHDRLLKMEYAQKEQARLLNYLASGRKGDPPPRANESNN